MLYEIQVQEVRAYLVDYTIEADSEEEARQAVMSGEVPEEDSQELLETTEVEIQSVKALDDGENDDE
jgi:hypothetical protein